MISGGGTENMFGGMLSVQIKIVGAADDDTNENENDARSETVAAARAVAAGCSLWAAATSLGGVESLIEHRFTLEGPGVPGDALRLSVGLEDAHELYRDLDETLRRHCTPACA